MDFQTSGDYQLDSDRPFTRNKMPGLKVNNVLHLPPNKILYPSGFSQHQDLSFLIIFNSESLEAHSRADSVTQVHLINPLRNEDSILFWSINLKLAYMLKSTRGGFRLNWFHYESHLEHSEKQSVIIREKNQVKGNLNNIIEHSVKSYRIEAQ